MAGINSAATIQILLFFSYEMVAAAPGAMRGPIISSDVHQRPPLPEPMHRSLFDRRTTMQTANTGGDGDLLLKMPNSFQIGMSLVLGFLLSLQIATAVLFVVHRKKRILEFAQPLAVCILLVGGVVTTAGCFLFLFISNVGCAIREPLILVSISFMGASIAGRAWRISTLMTNPMMSLGRSEELSRTEKARRSVLYALGVLADCRCEFTPNSATLRKLSMSSLRPSSVGNTAGRRRNDIRKQVPFSKLLRVVSLLVLPQLILQLIVILVPSARSFAVVSYNDYANVTFGQYECQSPAAGSWHIYLGTLFVALPLGIALLLNMRPKQELERLPDSINETEGIKSSISVGLLVLTTTLPIMILAALPTANAYAAVCATLGLPLGLWWHIAVAKLKALWRNGVEEKHRSSIVATGTSEQKSTVAFALKMSEMYSNMGQDDKVVDIIEETLQTFTKTNSNIPFSVSTEQTEEVGSGFTKQVLKKIDSEDLEVIIQLLRAKGKALMRIDGQSGMAQSAQLNIDILKIYENCPAAASLKDPSIIFPVYSLVAAQLKGGVINTQNDTSALERDLAERFMHEAQSQVYHYARALTNLAELYGRFGMYKEAFREFDTMKLVYLPETHSTLLTSSYAQDKCSHGFAMSAIWYMQQGKTERAIEQCDFVIANVLPKYDQKDALGLFNLLIPLIRVLKWNGHVSRAKQILDEYVSEEISRSTTGVGSLQRPISLLLSICDDPQYEINGEDIDLALKVDVPEMLDNVFMANAWSMKSMVAEICLHLAEKLRNSSGQKELLVRRGIRLSLIADEKMKDGRGRIKHLAAYNAHKTILSKLLVMASKCASEPISSAHDDQLSISRHSQSAGSLGSRQNSKQTVSFAKQLTVSTWDGSRSDISLQNASSTSRSNGGVAPSHIDTKSPSEMPKRVSSLGSNHSLDDSSSRSIKASPQCETRSAENGATEEK